MTRPSYKQPRSKEKEHIAITAMCSFLFLEIVNRTY